MMTNNKQIVAAFEEWRVGKESASQPIVQWGFFCGYREALTTTHEQYKPLVEALEVLEYVHNGDIPTSFFKGGVDEPQYYYD